MTLREQIKSLSGNRRRFFLLRIADLDTKAALKLVGVAHGTYNSWLQNQDFVTIYRRRDEFAGDYKQEAMQLLRRDNQLEAVLLEGKILAKMKEELSSGNIGEHSLLRSNLAKEVYSKLISDLDVVPQTPVISWQQRINQIFTNPPNQITEGEVIDAQFEANSQQETEYNESQSIKEGQQGSDAVKKED